MGISMVETINGGWVQAKLGMSPGALAFLINDDVLITVHVSSEVMCIHLRDNQGVYNYLTDLQFKPSDKNELEMGLFSPSIDRMFIGDSDIPLTNDLSKISDLKVLFNNRKKKEWFEKRVDFEDF